MSRGMRKGHETQEWFANIAISSLRTREEPLRVESTDADASLADLASSISALGIIEPIIVRDAGGGEFEVIAGERRLRAARLLHLLHVPCVVRECSDDIALLTALTENLQRADLSPIERAYGLKRLVNEFGLTQEEIGKRIGMSQSTIAHHLRLLALPAEVQSYIHAGDLSMGHGKLLAAVDDERQAVELATDCIANERSVRDLEELLASLPASARKPRSQASASRRRKEIELPNGVFLLIKEDSSTTCGTIEIPFYSMQEKEWVLAALARGNAAAKGHALIDAADKKRSGANRAQESFGRESCSKRIESAEASTVVIGSI